MKLSAASSTSQWVRINKTFLQMGSALDLAWIACQPRRERPGFGFAQILKGSPERLAQRIQKLQIVLCRLVAAVASAAVFKEEAEPKVSRATSPYAKVVGCLPPAVGKASQCIESSCFLIAVDQVGQPCRLRPSKRVGDL